VWHDVKIEHGGKTYRGSYEVSGGMITVAWEFGSKSARDSASNESLAKIMLRELVEEAQAKGPEVGPLVRRCVEPLEKKIGRR